MPCLIVLTAAVKPMDGRHTTIDAIRLDQRLAQDAFLA